MTTDIIQCAILSITLGCLFAWILLLVVDKCLGKGSSD